MSVRVGRHIVTSFLILLPLIAVGGCVVYHEAASGWPWSGPEWLHLCGRDYEKQGSPMSLARLDRQTGRRLQLYPVYRVLPVLGPEVYADTKPTDRSHAPGEPCTSALYTRTGADYQVFSLSGGV